MTSVHDADNDARFGKDIPVYATKHEPVRYCITEVTLEHVAFALHAGREAALMEHQNARVQHGDRFPMRVEWYADQVGLIQQAIEQLQREAPLLFPQSPSNTDTIAS